MRQHSPYENLKILKTIQFLNHIKIMKNYQAYPSLKRVKLNQTLFRLFVFSFFVLSILPAKAEVYLQSKISLRLMSAPLEKVFKEIEKVTQYSVFYQNSSIDTSKKISVDFKEVEIEEAMEFILKGTNIKFEILKNQIILTPKPSKIEKNLSQVGIIQENVIHGVVLDENKFPLLGATVKIKGTSKGTSTDFDGKFSLQAQPNMILEVSYVGFKTKEVNVGNLNRLEIVLETDFGALDEVIVVGYGTTDKQNIVGSVGVVNIQALQTQAPTINLDNALQGQLAGVYISSANGQPGAPARVRIRGTTSLQGSNQPLYVIDGIPVVPDSNIPTQGRGGQNLGSELAQQGLNTPIGNININDIESISVLKDASAGAIYGSRAANGVIIITTKTGKYGQGSKFNVDYSVSIQEPKTLDVLNAEQFKKVTLTAVQNGVINNAYTQSVLDGSYFGNVDTNWESMLKPSMALTSNFNINVQGGNESTRYFSAVGANNQEGSFKGSKFDRYSFKLNLNTKINEIWDFGVTSNLSFSEQQALDGALVDRMYIFRPDLPVYDNDGGYSFSQGYALENPVALSKARNSNQTLLLLTSIFTELKISEGLKARTLISLNYNNGNQFSFYPRFTSRGGWHRLTGEGDGYAQESKGNFSNVMWENTLRYNKSFKGIHNIDAVLGASFEQNSTSQVKAWGTGFFNDVLTNISSATVSRDASSLKTAYGLESYFGRLNYNYEGKYLMSFSARIDGSSKFARENKHAFFPAFALGWRLSEESFLSKFEKVDDLKLKVSWGMTGQQDFGPYQWRTLYETDDYGGQPSVVMTQLGNDRLKWERSKQFDVGLDYSFFNSRLSGTVGYYIKSTEDAIFTAITPGNTGFSSVLANVGSTENKGIEFEVNGDIIKSNNFNWNLSLNMSFNRNKLTKISDDFKDESGFLTGFPGGGRLKEGSPIGLIYGYVSEGIFQTQEEINLLNQGSSTGIYQAAATSPGDLKFKDINDDGRITAEDQEVIGDTQPDFFGGLISTVSLQGFSLTAMFTYSMGNDLHWFNQARSINFSIPHLEKIKHRKC